MGILLPPVTQVTTATTNALTLHHRNRSLDSALQRIPEVDITPSPECETVVTSILSSTSSSTSANHTDSTRPVSAPSKPRSDEVASLGSDDSGILCGSETSTLCSSDASNLCGSEGSNLCGLDGSNLCGSDSGILSGSETGSCSDSNATRESSVECLGESNESLTTTNEKSEEDTLQRTEDTNTNAESSSSVPKSSGMLRLLESKVFDVSMAMHYLFNSKEPGVLCYIVNKMFSFEDHEVDFYLPQLVCMYIQMHDVAEVIHRYLIHR